MLQGQLQKYFDALYQMGVIEPLLKMEWRELQLQREAKAAHYHLLFQKISQTPDHCLIETFRALPKEDVYAIAMEVAHEFVQYVDRQQLH